MTAFISGHGDVTWQEFEEHYVPRIAEAVNKGHSIIVGDFRGLDTDAMKYLQYVDEQYMTVDLTVYHMFTEPRNTVDCAKHKGGFTSDHDRDSAMTRDSDYDIAWVRPGKENSGTANNIRRRQ